MEGHKPLLFFTMAALRQAAAKSGWKHSREFIRPDTREKYFTNKKNNTHVTHFLENRICQKLVVRDDLLTSFVFIFMECLDLLDGPNS
jgi:hypothetical protein